MKTYLIIILLSILTITSNAQEVSVFKELKWADAMSKAQAQKKNMLVEVYSSGMIKQDLIDKLNHEVFSNTEIEKILSDDYICTSINMGTENGQSFKPYLSGSMYPCFLLLNENGHLLARSGHYKALENLESFKEILHKAVVKSEIKRNNTRKIEFLSIDIEEAKSRAAKENKLIFIDAFFVGCHWCTEMENDVFCLDKVADFYNDHFICLKIDFIKNKEIRKTYKANGYPAYFYINSKVDVIFQETGYTTGEKFIEYGRTALKPL